MTAASRILNRERKKCQHSFFWTWNGQGEWESLLDIPSVHYHATMAAIVEVVDDDGDDG